MMRFDLSFSTLLVCGTVVSLAFPNSAAKAQEQPAQNQPNPNGRAAQNRRRRAAQNGQQAANTNANANAAGITRTDTTGWQAFEMSLDAMPAGIDVGAMIGHKPAGKFGPIQARNGRFEFGNGEEVRLWGANLTKGDAFPPKEQAARVARHLARMGFNSIRFHHVGLMLMDKSRDDSQHLDASTLDRLEFFIARLKEEGIYTDINLLTNQWEAFKAGDNLPDYAALAKGGRVAHFFDTRLIEVQKERARALLSHGNPYTGMSLAQDPAVAVVEIINETSFTGSGETGENTKLPPFYAKELDGLFNDWLKTRYPNEAALKAAWGALKPGESWGTVQRTSAKTTGKAAPSQRVRDVAAFYESVENRYYREMTRFLRQDLGFKGLINGTNNWYGLSALHSQMATDYTDIHGYVDHPKFPRQKWDRNDFEMMQMSAVRNPEGFEPGKPLTWPNIVPIHKWALGGVEGMPLMSSEWNWAYPNRYGYEGPMMVAAYGSLQQLNGFYLFTYDNVLGNGQIGFFQLQPSMMAQMPVAALAFRRGDVAPARETVTLEFSDADVLDASLKYGTGFSHNSAAEVPLSTAIVHKIRKRFTGTKPANKSVPGNLLTHAQSPFTSDTGELTWKGGDSGAVTIKTPRLQAAIGFVSGQNFDLGSVRVSPRANGAVSVISLDGKPLSESSDLLLTAVGRQEATGQAWSADNTGLKDWGKKPMLLEPVRGDVELLTINKNLKVFALNSEGKRVKEVVTNQEARGLKFSLSGDVTWYRLQPR